jgi:hypothetical protein
VLPIRGVSGSHEEDFTGSVPALLGGRFSSCIKSFSASLVERLFNILDAR